MIEVLEILGKIFKPIQLGFPINSQPPIVENGEPLIKIKPIANRLFICPSYFEQQLPNSLKSIYLRQQAAKQLFQALSTLPKEYSFILYDGFRPLQVQSYLFEKFQSEIQKNNPHWTFEQIRSETLKYVAFPSVEKGYPAPHLTGGAIDLTLGDSFGLALDLGTAFDETNFKSATTYFEVHPTENSEAFKNRRILFHSMTDAGFQNYEEEWWHYDYGNVTWARKADKQQAIYGPILATIEQNEVKEYRFI